MLRMRSHFCVVLVLIQILGSLGHTRPPHHGHQSSAEWLPRVPVAGNWPSAEVLVAEKGLPTDFDWRHVNGMNLVTADWNQHIPQYCGACWIHGTLSALNDRIKVMRAGQFPDVRLGRQSIMNCVPGANESDPPPGCDGGDAWMIHHYMHKTKVPDETCMPYQAKNMGCTPDTICSNCATTGGCWAVKNFISYGVSSYGSVSGEQAMMKEIYARGPIVCSFATDARYMLNFSEVAARNEGVYTTRQKKKASDVDHDMEVAGWGETPSGLKYWAIRNSWGTYWGETGWLKMERGTNALLMESDCAWAVPSFEGLDEDLAGRVMGDYRRGILPKTEVEERVAAEALQSFPLATQALSATFLTAVSAACLAGAFMAVIIVRVTEHKDTQSQQPFIMG